MQNNLCGEAELHSHKTYRYRIFSGWLYVEDMRDFLKSIKDISKDYGIEITIIDANYITNLDNLRYAVMRAIDSWTEKRNIAKTLSMEVLLYISATRQIKDAVKIGFKEGKNRVYLVLISPNTDIEKIDSQKLRSLIPEFKPEIFEKIKLDDDNLKKIMELYGIEEKELKIVGLEKIDMLIRERIVLFELGK